MWKRLCNSFNADRRMLSQLVAKSNSEIRPRSASIPSSLFVSNSVARKTSEFNVALGLEHVFEENYGKLQENFKRRKMDFDLDTFAKKLDEFKYLQTQKIQLEKEKLYILEQMRLLMGENGSQNVVDSTALDDLRKHGKSVRLKLKELNPRWWGVEEQIMLDALRIPTDLDSETPDQPVILKSNGLENQKSYQLDHVFIGQKDGLIKFSNVGRKAYYLFKETAELEQNLLCYVSRRLDEAGYRSMACPDAFRSSVIEGCGQDFTNSEETLLIKDSGDKHPKIADSLYLGGSGLSSIASYLCKTRIHENDLPMKFYTKGPNYAARCASLTDDDGLLWEADTELMSRHDEHMNCLHPSFGLYEALQTSTFHSVVLSEEQDSRSCNEEMIAYMWDIFTGLNLPGRMVQIPADRLHVSQSSRTELQLYSPVLQKYITTAYVANVRDFVSRRLEIMTENGHYCFVNHSCVFDVTKSIASYLENYYDPENKRFVIPGGVKYSI